MEKIDFIRMYQAHECYMDYDLLNFHLYDGLKTFKDLEKFLEFYHGIGLDEACWKADNFKPIDCDVKARKKSCASCPHSKENRKNAGNYRENHSSGKVYDSCPYEVSFAEGYRVDVIYVKPPHCPECGSIAGKMYAPNKKPVDYFDVRLNDKPCILRVVRKRFHCLKCGKQVFVGEIERIQFAPKFKLTFRLAAAVLYHTCDEVPHKVAMSKVASGYGIPYITIKRYVNLIRNTVRKQMEEKTAETLQAIIADIEIGARPTVPGVSSFYTASYATSTGRAVCCFTDEYRYGQDDDKLYLSACFGPEYNELVECIKTSDSLMDCAFQYKMSEAQKTILAYHFVLTEYPDIDSAVAYYAIRLFLEYQSAVTRGLGDAVINQAIESFLFALFRKKDTSSRMHLEIIFSNRIWKRRKVGDAAKYLWTLMKENEEWDQPLYGAEKFGQAETDQNLELVRKIEKEIRDRLIRNKMVWDSALKEDTFFLSDKLMFLNTAIFRNEYTGERKSQYVPGDLSTFRAHDWFDLEKRLSAQKLLDMLQSGMLDA